MEKMSPVHQRDASVAAAVLPESVVRYVMRTQEGVILDDASSGIRFPPIPTFFSIAPVPFSVCR